MDNNSFFAHIAQDGRAQTVKSHLIETSKLAQEFARPFGGEAQAALAGLAHDIGKYSVAFQRRLHGSTAHVDHSTAGAAECWKMSQMFAAFAVAGHHGGLPEGGGQMDDMSNSSLLARIKRGAAGKLEPYDEWQNNIQLPNAEFPDYLQKSASEAMFYTRMLYSCLVDADYLDTEAFMNNGAREQNGTTVDTLLDRLTAYISKWFPPKGELNRLRCNILETCISKGALSPGLFSLTVPTGGGKTIASLAFALNHAKSHGFRRVIYVIPYTSIIEQTAEKFREVLGEENVLEHHSNVIYDPEEETDARTIRLIRATENWDMPVVVTTAVQFFESLYSCRPSQCRKLHNIAGSVIVFDEAQMMPFPHLRPCVHAISQLISHYNVSAVLCTATQPALNKIFTEFLPDSPITELCPEELRQQEIFRRVSFRREGKLSTDDLARRLNSLPQVLCIVNTRKYAQDLFSKLDTDGRFHLSTLMYPEHRRAQLKEIFCRLSSGQPCRVVSTSLIEAGVDVDFPNVYRELSGLDSILQAAGRCNREGKRPADESFLTIFEGEERPPMLFATAIGVCRYTLQRHTDILSETAIQAYFNQLYAIKGDGAQDVQQILPTIEHGFFPFRTIAERFHLIDAPTQTVFIPLGQGEALAERLRSGERSRSLFRQIGLYGVSVYNSHFSELNRSGDIELLEDGTAILLNTALYSPETGLSPDADSGKGLFI